MNENLIERFSRNRRAEAFSANKTSMLREKLNIKVQEYYQPVQNPLSAGPWLDRPELPTSAEVMDMDGDSEGSDIVEIAPNQIEGPWESKEAYLSAHYELLREDAVRPLRDTICRIRKDPELNEEAFSKSTGIYQDVYIRAVTCSTRGIALRVTFSTFRAQKKILWEQSKRLITGSLVVLTPASDMFQKKAIVATVAARKLAVINQDPPEIDLFIARAAELEIDPAMKFVMVEERSAYYEADRHTLLALQKMATEPFPLSEHLVGVQPTVPAPAYVKAKPIMNLTGVFHDNKNENYENVQTLEGWPQLPQSDLDKSQTAALHCILTKQLSIVQGPPGTGKTFVSVQAIKVMIANMKPGDPPIIVTCQTNHALDQLLRHIAKFEEEFVRLGGRSKDKDVIKKRTLFEVRNSESSNPPAGGMGRGPRVKMQQLEKEIELILEPLKESVKGLIDHDVLEKMGLLSSKQAESLVAGASQWTQATLSNPNEAARSPLTVWLGRSLEVVPRPGESQDFGFAPEETDLEYEQLQEIEAENFAKEDEEFDELYGSSYAIADHFTGRKVASLTAERLKNVLKERDMWKIPENLRGAVYRHLQHAAKKCIRDSLRENAILYDKQAMLRRISLWEKDEIILRKQKVIGMTTTGFSKYRGLISALQPRVVLIEEAGETREAPVAVTCVSSLQQLILVGDHQQLRPHCNMSAHENKPYFLNISLFERMVKNSVEYNMLVKQRRMIPEIRRLLHPIYHGAIEDHASVLRPTNRPNVPGMGGVNSFFFSHAWQEQRDDQMSCINRDEADMIVGFVEHLIYNGMGTDDITILTFYNGQRKCILSALRNSVMLEKRRFNVVTVDSYQGEENKVVVLSLVRSNSNNSIGFLGVENRVCVALSRAQCGFYMFGNGKLLWDSGSKLWRKVLTIVAGQKNKAEVPQVEPNRLSETLPVVCANHGIQTKITAADDWQNISGGCAQPCDAALSCGHHCPLTCHPFPHDTVCCHYQCESLLECGHTCSAMCGELCSCKVCAKVKIHRTKESSETKSQASSGSSKSWKSYSEEEQIRYAAALSTMPHNVRSSVAISSVQQSHPVELSEMADGACDIQSMSLKDGKKAALRPQNRSSDKSAGGVNLLD